jgi:hypothetical protein
MAILRIIRAVPLVVLLVAAGCDVRITIVEVHPAPAATDRGPAR